MPRLLVAAALMLAVAGSAWAQSLADVARREEARRKQIQKPSKVLTNKDLKPSEAPLPPPPAAADVAKPATPADGAASAPDQASPADDADKLAQDEQAWRQKMTDARTALERSQMFLDALQSKINSLWADFTARDDPAQRAQIEADRKRAMAESERVKGEIETEKKAIADLEEEARKAGVPPGWLR
jgi:hypothetical protein